MRDHAPMPTAQTSVQKKPGYFARLWRQQKEAVYGDAARQNLQQTKGALRTLIENHRKPRRVETFDAACARLNLTDSRLQQLESQFKTTHWAMYALGAILSVYALYLGLNVGKLHGLSVLIAATAALVQGYVSGFRAWQLQNRRFIKLQDAIRLPGTYLVL